MKTKSFNFLLLLIMAFGISSCTKSNTIMVNTNANTTKVTFDASLKGASETPPNNSTATGNAIFTYDKTTSILTGTVTFQGITPIGVHIHKGAVGVAGEVVFQLDSGTITSPISFMSTALDSAQRADLMADLYYVNIHSTTFLGGEIRGQLTHSNSSVTAGTNMN